MPDVNACYKFPAVGYRNNTNGALTDAGTSGRYWADEQLNATVARMFICSSNSAGVTSFNKTYGFSVRCVRPRIYDPDF